MSNLKAYWYCPYCRAEVDPKSVNYQEEHVVCGTNVQWISGEVPKPEAIEEVDWKEFETIGFLTRWLNENKVNVIAAFQALHGSYRLIYSAGVEKPADQSLTEDKELEQLKAENSKMRKALEKSLEWIADIKQKDIPLDDKKGMVLYHIKWLATEALKTT